MMTTTNSLLSAHDLEIGYQSGASSHRIASNLELALQPGEFVCLLGPNGTGKSTLIRTLSGMQDPLNGDIHFNGAPFSSFSPRQRARLISVVLTEAPPIGMMDAYSLVSVGRHPYSGWFGGLDVHDRERIEWALKAVGAEHLAKRQIAELSDGERQKVSIARALAQETKVMLLDEPTAFLDLPRRVELMSILRQLAHKEGLALLLSTHDLDLALRFADRLWVLNNKGQIIKGFPEAIAMSGEFAEVFESANLDWDPRIGSFRAHPTPCLHAKVDGNGIASLWTKRALERLGFGLTENESIAAFSIQIENESAWKVNKDGANQSFESIDELIDWILAETWA